MGGLCVWGGGGEREKEHTSKSRGSLQNQSQQEFGVLPVLQHHLYQLDNFPICNHAVAALTNKSNYYLMPWKVS